MHDSERHRTVLDVAMESLDLSGTLRFRAQGASMMPTIPPGSCVEVRKVASGQITVGDIVLTRASDSMQLHRVVDIRPGSFVTRGDNRNQDDPPSDYASLLGRLDAIVSKPRLWSRLLAKLR